MDTTNDAVSRGHAIVDKAADHLQGGLREAQHTADAGASALSNKVDTIRRNAGPAMEKAVDATDGLLTRSLNAVADASRNMRAKVADTQDSIVGYTTDNPVKELIIAAATGAVLVSLIRALGTSRD